MANKIKKVSINAFEKAVNSHYEPTRSIEWNGITVVVKYNLTLREMMSFVDKVVKNCFKESDGSFMPEIKNFAERSCIYEYYTNITLPSNIEKQYDLLYHQSLLDQIMSNIDLAQFNSMMRAIDDKVKHTAQANIDNITRQVNELMGSLENTQKEFGDIFSDIDKNSVLGVINAFGDGVIDEGKIAKAVLEYKQKNGDEK